LPQLTFSCTILDESKGLRMVVTIRCGTACAANSCG
jgi:hypothetical protein